MDPIFQTGVTDVDGQSYDVIEQKYCSECDDGEKTAADKCPKGHKYEIIKRTMEEKQ